MGVYMGVVSPVCGRHATACWGIIMYRFIFPCWGLEARRGGLCRQMEHDVEENTTTTLALARTSESLLWAFDTCTYVTLAFSILSIKQSPFRG